MRDFSWGGFFQGVEIFHGSFSGENVPGGGFFREDFFRGEGGGILQGGARLGKFFASPFEYISLAHFFELHQTMTPK